ncbi:MAG: magnesium/cobalt transporter CorA [Myxococcota bacterium]
MAKGKKAATRKRKGRKRRRRPSWVPRYEGGPPGAPPGTLHVDPEAPAPRIDVFAYGPDGMTESKVRSPDELRAYLDRWAVTWVNVEGLGDADVLVRIGEVFGLHALALEDVVHLNQRPKAEPYRDHFYVVTHMAHVVADRIETEQLSLFVGKGFVLTFQERPGADSLDPVRARIREGRGRIRSMGADYLAYALLDAVIDHYFPVVEHYADRLETLERQVLARPDSPLLATIMEARRELLGLRRLFWPLREAVSFLSREEHALMSQDTRIHLRDAHDHLTRIIEGLESCREISSTLLDVYLSAASHRMNEVMKVLTIIATIFIPLTFIVGIYGMNFDPDVSPWNMPELRWPYAYPVVLGVMAGVALGLLYYFRRKGWLGGDGSRRVLHEAEERARRD